MTIDRCRATVEAYSLEEIEASPPILRQHRLYSKTGCRGLLVDGRCPHEAEHLKPLDEAKIQEMRDKVRSGKLEG